MRFDWYQATIGGKLQDIIEAFINRYGPGHDIVEARGIHGYAQRFNVVEGKGMVVASVICGGNRGAFPNAWASGDDTENFIQVVRSEWPTKHVVTRMDACEDFQAVDAYAQLRAVLRQVAKPAGVKCREILPDDDPDEGRTYYAGSPSSDVRVRLYDKGLQVRRTLPPEQAAQVPADWIRFEVQVRPKGQSRQDAAVIEAAEAWGFSPWTKKAALKALDLEVPRVVIRPWRESDDERAYRFMIQQYGNLLRRKVVDHGSWSALGAQIGEDIQAHS